MNSPDDFMERYAAALATQDWAVVAPLIHHDACVTFSNGAFHIGKAEVQKAFERNFQLIEDEEYSLADMVWVKQEEDFAVCLYAFQWQGLIDGKPAGGSGRGTSVLAKEDTQWYLLVEHLGP